MFISKYESNDKKQFQQNKHVRVCVCVGGGGGVGLSVGHSVGRSVCVRVKMFLLVPRSILVVVTLQPSAFSGARNV